MGNQTEADIQLLAGLDIDSSEAEILKAIKIIDKRLRAHKDARIKLIPEIDETVVTEVLGKLQTIFKSKDLSIDCKDSILNIQKEATAMMDVVFSANKASKEKLEFTKANKKVEKSAQETADAIIRERQAMDNLDDLDYILRNVNASGNAGNSVFQTFGNTLSNAFQTYTMANLLTDAIQESVEAGKEAIKMTKEWDDAATSLRMATGASKETVDQYMDSYNELGKEIGAITQEVSESADGWLRQGHSIEDTNTLIRDSMILSKVSNLESAESQEYLTSSMKGYKVAVEDVINIVDKLTSVDLVSATDAGGLAEAMSRTATTANAVGVSMDKLLGYIAVVGETSGKSMSSVGESFKTIFTRMSDIKSNKLELIDEDGTTELLSDVELTLSNVGINLRETVTEYNSYSEVLDNLASKWDTLSQVQQNALQKAFAGTRQADNFRILMENYSTAQKYANTASQSLGTAEEKFGYYLESLESKSNSLKASLEELTHTTISDELYASVLDTSKAVVDLTTDTGILKGLLAGLGTSGAIYTFQQLTRYLRDATHGFANLNEAMSMTRGGTVGINDMQRLIDLTGGLSQSQTRLLLSTTNLTDAQKISILMNQGMSQAQAQTFLTTNHLSAAQQGATTATVTLNGALKGLWTTLLANPLVLVTTAVTAGVTAFNAYKNNVEEVRQATEQSATTYKESTSSIDDYILRYQDLQQALQDAKGDEEATANVKQQLLDLQTELNEKYGDEYGKLNLVTDAYRDQTDAIKELSKAEANRYLNENRKGIATATAKMEKEQDYVLSAPTLSVNTPDGKALQEIVDSYTDEGMRLISDDATGAVQIVLKADAQTAYETLNNFETDLRNKAQELGNENLFDDILDFSTNALNNAKSIIDKYGEIYNQAQMANLATDKDASSVYEKALSAVEEYNNAVMASEDPFSDENVAKAKANVESVMAEAEGLGKYGTIFADVFDQADRRLLDFNEKLKNDTSLQEWAEQLRGKEIVDLKSMVNDGQDDVFDKLVESAEEYDITVDELINTLIRLGYVQGDVTSGEDVFKANTVSLESLNNQIDSIQSAYKGLTTACEEYNQYGYITADTLQTLLSMDSQYLACLINENGQLQINGQTYQALVQAKLADAEATAVQQAIEELGTVTTEQQISADTTAIGVMAQKGTALATLTGQYAALANVAVSAAQAQALADAYTDASSKNKEEADRIMSNLNTKLALIQNTAKNTSGSFGALTNHLNGFSDASGKASKSTDALTDSLKKQKEALTEQKEELEELHDAVQWFYDTKIDKINDTIDKINEEIDLLEKQQATMDDIIKAIENNYDAEISLIQDKIDALKDANDEEEKALKLEEAKRKLQEAKSRKTLMVYTKNAGFTYQVDTSAIKEAESELAELQENEVVNELEKQIDALEEAKEKWSEIPDAYNKAMQEIAASNYFGANWKDITLLPSDELLANFEGKYTGIQSSIDSKNDKIDSLEKEKQKLEELKSLWEDAKNSYRNSQYEAQLASFFGSDYEYQLLNNSASWRRKFASEYSSICAEIASVEEQLKSLNEETASSVESGANRISNAANGVRSALENTGNISKYIWTEDDTNALEYARQRLDALNQLIGQGRTELTDARDKVANFVDQYSKLKDSRLVTDELKNSVQELNGVYGQSGDYLEQMASGVANRLADSKNYTSELVQNTQTTADNLAQVNDQINNLKTSEETVEDEADKTVSNVEITISNLLTKLGELQTKLGEISLSRTEVEAIADEELLDTSAVVDGVHTKVSEIQTAITTLMESITPLHGALDTLMEKMTTLDEVTLSKVISAFGGAYGGEGGESKESGSKSSSKGKKGSEGESGGGSGLLSAVKAVDEAIGSVDNEESLLGKLAQVDASTLENIIAQFGLSGENGDSEGANLLNAVNAVSQAIVGGGKDDENSLIASIEQFGSDPTIEHVTTVSDSFQTLHDTINECVKKVEELSKAIESIPSSTATVGVNGGKSSGKAKGGIVTKRDAGEFDVIAHKLGEDHMVALTEGEAVVPKETVEENPEVVNSLLSGQKLDLKALVNRDIVLQRATPLDNYSMFEKYKDWVIPDSVIMSRLNLPSQDFSKLGVVNNNQKETVVQFNGDIHVHEVQNVDTLSKAIVQQLPRKMTQALSRRDL